MALTDRTVCRSIIMEQHPFSSPVQLWPNQPDTLQQSVQNCLVKCGTNSLTCRIKSLWMMPLLPKKAVNSVLTLDFCRRLFFSRGEVSEHHAINCRFDSGLKWQHLVSSPVTMFYRSNGSWSYMETKSPEVSIHFDFCSSVSLCENRDQIFCLPKSSRTMV